MLQGNVEIVTTSVREAAALQEIVSLIGDLVIEEQAVVEQEAVKVVQILSSGSVDFHFLLPYVTSETSLPRCQ